MRITLVSDADLVNSNYRAYQPMHVLSRKGHTIRYNATGEPRFRPGALLQSDAVLIHRYLDPEILHMVVRLRNEGIGVVWDNDDDIMAVPRTNPNYAKFGGTKGRAISSAIGRIAQLAHVLTTPSPVLAEKFRAAGAQDVRVLENCLPTNFARVSPVKHDGVVLTWLAGLEHQVDYQQLHLHETFERLLDAHADLRIMSIGLGLGLRTDRYEHIKLVDFLDLARTLARCDIGIAPLVDIPWNQARSNVKLKEYGSAGLPWLASPVGAYVGLGEKQGGRLVSDHGWHEAIDELIRDARARRKLAKRATKWARGQTIDKHAHLWEAAFRDAIERARAGTPGR